MSTTDDPLPPAPPGGAPVGYDPLFPDARGAVGVATAPPAPPDGAPVGYDPLFPDARGAVGVATGPPAVLRPVPVAEYEARAAELADSASAIGQTVYGPVSSQSSFRDIADSPYSRESNNVGHNNWRGTGRAVGDRRCTACDGVCVGRQNSDRG